MPFAHWKNLNSAWAYLALSIALPCMAGLPACLSEGDSSPALPTESYKVIGIVDGDTYDILKDRQSVRIRMDAIDAPERGMPYYRVSKDYLSQLCFGKPVRLEVLKTDRHGRTVARSFLSDGTDLSAAMISAGMAWHYKAYSSDTLLARLEINARQMRKGLWADKHPAPPWDIRALRRAGHRVEFTRDTFLVVD